MVMDVKNVLEAAAIYDSICISPPTGMFGNEKQADGWFTSFQDFGAWTDHLFFKSRNESSVGLAYNNMQSADKLDFAFHAMSIGVRFFGPITSLERDASGTPPASQQYLSHFFQYDLPNHCSITLRVGQDDYVDLPGMSAPPGYGPTGGAASMGVDSTGLFAGNTYGLPFSRPQSVFVGTQGTPDKRNRYSLMTTVTDENGQTQSSPLEIPRNETIQVTLKLSEFAQDFLKKATVGPLNYLFGNYQRTDASADPAVPIYTDNPIVAPVRYGITVSIYGVREIQQRGELHAV
jgi:hypothetical protein